MALSGDRALSAADRALARRVAARLRTSSDVAGALSLAGGEGGQLSLAQLSTK